LKALQIFLILLVGLSTYLIFRKSGPLPERRPLLDQRNWPHYSRDLAGTKYSPLDQINRANFSKLEIIWRWSSLDNQLKPQSGARPIGFQATPIAIDGTLYSITSLGLVFALNGTTGELKWSFDSKAYEKKSSLLRSRGVSYWQDSQGSQKRILFGTTDGRLISLSAKSGTPTASFGKNGQVNLLEGFSRKGSDLSIGTLGVNSPPLICNHVVVVGSQISDYIPSKWGPPGDVRGFDVRTGKILWTFRTVPQKEDWGTHTWADNSWLYSGNANVWTWMSADESENLVYLPVSTPTSDHFGGHRHGNNLFADSIVALDCQTGERRWHYQMVHHGLWDYDPPAAPNLLDLTIQGKKIKALAQVTKQGFVYVLNRITGKPIWPVIEKNVPPSRVLGEKTSLTQPFPSKPPPFEWQGVTEKTLINLHPKLIKRAQKILGQYVVGPLFTPPSVKKNGTLTLPGSLGGASWSGAAVDPIKGYLFVPSITLATVNKLIKNKSLSDFDLHYVVNRKLKQVRDLGGLSVSTLLFRPPYGRITAYDLNKGEFLWKRPLVMGRGPVNEPQVQHYMKNTPWEQKPLGWPRRSFVLLTPTFLLAAQMGNQNHQWEDDKTFLSSEDPVLQFIEPQTGKIVHEIQIPDNISGSPMTFGNKNGKQLIIVPIGGLNIKAQLIAIGIK